MDLFKKLNNRILFYKQEAEKGVYNNPFDVLNELTKLLEKYAENENINIKESEDYIHLEEKIGEVANEFISF